MSTIFLRFPLLPLINTSFRCASITIEVSDGQVVYKPELQLIIYVHQDLSLEEHRIVITRNVAL